MDNFLFTETILDLVHFSCIFHIVGHEKRTFGKMNTPYVNVQEIKARYAPYHTMPEFEQGYADYMAGKIFIANIPGVGGQAYDRGAEAAMKVKNAARWVEVNVGKD